MTRQRIFSLSISTFLCIILGFFVMRGGVDWDEKLAYFLHTALFVYFLAVLISNQQYEEDTMAKIERIFSSALVSFTFFFQMIYAPMARYFFGNMIHKAAFFPTPWRFSCFFFSLSYLL